MACVQADGTLSPSAQAMLDALQERRTIGDLAALTGLPMFRLRSGLREMISAGLVEEKEGVFVATRSVDERR